MSAPNRQHILTPLVENETSKTASSSVSSRLEVNKQLTSCLTGSKQRSSRAVSLEPRSLSSYKHNTIGVGATISNAVPSSTIPQWAKTRKKLIWRVRLLHHCLAQKLKSMFFKKYFFLSEGNLDIFSRVLAYCTSAGPTPRVLPERLLGNHPTTTLTLQPPPVFPILLLI